MGRKCLFKKCHENVFQGTSQRWSDGQIDRQKNFTIFFFEILNALKTTYKMTSPFLICHTNNKAQQISDIHRVPCDTHVTHVVYLSYLSAPHNYVHFILIICEFRVQTGNMTKRRKKISFHCSCNTSRQRMNHENITQ